jgi:hypothetical protein
LATKEDLDEKFNIFTAVVITVNIGAAIGAARYTVDEGKKLLKQSNKRFFKKSNLDRALRLINEMDAEEEQEAA